MPASAEVIAHSPSGSCSARKCFRARLVDAFAQMQQQARLLLQPRQETLGAPRVHVGDPGHRFGQVRLVGLLDVADDAAVVAPGAGIAEELDALARRDAADQALALDVADERGHDVSVSPSTFIGPRDETLILGCAAPLSAVGEQPRHVPQAQRVVGEVVVELDEAGKDRPPDIDGARRLEAGRRRLRRVVHGDDAALIDVDRAATRAC